MWGIRGGSAFGPTLCQGLSPQKGLSEDRYAYAFNSLRRDSFLSVTHFRTPGLWNLLWQAYSSPTRLFSGKEGFVSEPDIQQGGPIEPAIFTLSDDEDTRSVKSGFNVWYFDDASVTPWRGFTTI